jgi:hypothetical protein
MSSGQQLRRTERGFGGHFICASDCRYRRNTLLEYGDTRVVVSSVGNMVLNNKTEYLGINRRIYETMVFHAKYEKPYWEADTGRQIDFESDWAIHGKIKREHDLKADEIHEKVIEEISNKMVGGEIK